MSILDHLDKKDTRLNVLDLERELKLINAFRGNTVKLVVDRAYTASGLLKGLELLEKHLYDESKQVNLIHETKTLKEMHEYLSGINQGFKFCKGEA